MTVYHACKYAPVELLRAFGVPVERLDPTPVSFDCADSCLHPNLCGFGKGVVEAVMAQDIRALVLTDCCDVMRRVYDALLESGRLEFLWLLSLPHKKGPAEIRRFHSALSRLAEAFSAYSGRTFDPSLAEPDPVPEQSDGPFISLSGAHGGAMLMARAQTAIGLPIRDDTCSGARTIAWQEERGTTLDAFLDWYAPALLGQRPCMRMLHVASRDLFDEPGLRGVIYHTLKFCDYYGFEYAAKKDRIAVPLLKIETDGTDVDSGQLDTRLTAFAETLEARPRRTGTGGGLRCAAGVDVGSAGTKAAVMDSQGRLLGYALAPSGTGAARGASQALEEALNRAGLTRDDLAAVVTTGYGRANTGLEASIITEITCHARGAHYLDPEARTVIDIGGQDSKVIGVDDAGRVTGFVMNDKCAAGTGRFLEMMARTMELSMEELAERGLHWKQEVSISSMCTVFAESEVVSLLARNTPAEDVIHGLNRSVAEKTAALVSRQGGREAYLMTGGVAENAGVVQELSKKLGAEVRTDPLSRYCGAIGAALLALEQE